MTDTVEVTLKPCPFCGGEAKLRSWDWPYERHQVRCSECKAHARARMASKAEAITAWNTRHEATRELVEAVGPIIQYHASGGHEGDGSDAAVKRALKAIAKHTEAAR